MQPISVISTPEDLSTLIRSVDPVETIKHLRASKATLGGEDRATLFVHASLQKKEDWSYNIFHNSPYGIFSISCDDKMTLISSGPNMPKFRKCKIKSLQHAAEKIVAYFESAQ